MKHTAEWISTEANTWITNNPDAWERMKTIARRYVQHNTPFSIASICEVARYEFMTVGNVDGYKINNTLRAAFARRLIDEVPEAAKYVHTRKSVLDGQQ